MEKHVLPIISPEFPMKVVMGKEVVTFDTPEDVPPDAQFKLYVVPESEAKIINSGVARVWSNNAVD